MEVLEGIIKAAKIPNVDCEGATEDLVLLLESGAMDEDIEELVAKYSTWFSLGVETRLVKQFATILWNRRRKNHPLGGTKYKASISPDILAATSDL